MQRLQGSGETQNGIALLRNRQRGPHQIEAVARNPPDSHPCQVTSAARCYDRCMRNRGRQRFQEQTLTSKSLPVTSPAHPEHKIISDPRVVRPALRKGSPVKIQGRSSPDNLQTLNSPVHGATVQQPSRTSR